MVSRIPRGGRKTNAKKMFHGHIGWVNDSWSQPAMDEFAGAVKWSPLHASLTEDWLDMYIRTPMFNNLYSGACAQSTTEDLSKY